MSKQYVRYRDIPKFRKLFDVNTPVGRELHIYRNQNQFGLAPRDFETMAQFVEMGYFIYEGFTPCHNIVVNTPEERKDSLGHYIYCLKKKIITIPNKYATLGNVGFRGRPSTPFEGCQFVYNHKTGKLVTDSVNRGTWDYGKSGTGVHVIFDINPWIIVGNGDNVETSDQFIMNPKDEEMYLSKKIKGLPQNNINRKFMGRALKKIQTNPELMNMDLNDLYNMIKNNEDIGSADGVIDDVQ